MLTYHQQLEKENSEDLIPENHFIESFYYLELMYVQLKARQGKKNEARFEGVLNLKHTECLRLLRKGDLEILIGNHRSVGSLQ